MPIDLDVGGVEDKRPQSLKAKRLNGWANTKGRMFQRKILGNLGIPVKQLSHSS